ncbi:MAG: hypothetical protein OXC83_00510 [Chloroflexi bacterium]|nr:hypothetical protein [Chloroflexota bacterium]
MLAAIVLTACSTGSASFTVTPEPDVVSDWYGDMSAFELGAVACGHIGRAFGSYSVGNVADERAHAIVATKIDMELKIGVSGDVSYGDALRLCSDLYGVNVAVNGISPTDVTSEPSATPTIEPSPTITPPTGPLIRVTSKGMTFMCERLRMAYSTMSSLGSDAAYTHVANTMMITADYSEYFDGYDAKTALRKCN